MLTALRAAGRSVPAVIITAFADVDRLKRALNLGASFLLEKPFRGAELVETVRKLLGDQRDLGGLVTEAIARSGLTEREAGDRAPRPEGPAQPRDRDGARVERQDGAPAHLTHLREVRRVEPARSCSTTCFRSESARPRDRAELTRARSRLAIIPSSSASASSRRG